MVTALSGRCKLVEISGAKAQFPFQSAEVFHALAQLGMACLDATERVYGVDRRPPVARVAALLLYLGSISDVKIIRTSASDGTSSYVHLEHDTVSGPTQTDIADSLGISRASVEKALAVLRDRGVLHKAEPDQSRRNRRYKIKDRARLAFIAHTGQV
ncbi:helix-turn-helix domain-containing protein [Streptomyces sp. NPDC051041]|uniref:helix-turn-helix domain-containing protein n=1 Tax=Streptomyces sp. NPDC051041 TaxID=3365640 RepID=UPI0037B4FB29